MKSPMFNVMMHYIDDCMQSEFTEIQELGTSPSVAIYKLLSNLLVSGISDRFESINLLVKQWSNILHTMTDVNRRPYIDEVIVSPDGRYLMATLAEEISDGEATIYTTRVGKGGDSRLLQ